MRDINIACLTQKCNRLYKKGTYSKEIQFRMGPMLIFMEGSSWKEEEKYASELKLLI